MFGELRFGPQIPLFFLPNWHLTLSLSLFFFFFFLCVVILENISIRVLEGINFLIFGYIFVFIRSLIFV
jgi:hypothetical protein